MNMFQIYWLSDPRTSEMRYVGKTKSKLINRHGSHCKPKDKNKSHCANWVRTLLKDNLLPQIHSLQTFNAREDMDEAEKYWIAHFRSLGCRLTNMTHGGDGGSQPKRQFSDNHRKNLSIAMKGRTPAIKGKLLSDEAKKKISDKAKGRPAWNKGTRKPKPPKGPRPPQSALTRQKKSIAMKGRKLSEETKKKLSESKKGKKLPPRGEAYRKKMSDAIKLSVKRRKESSNVVDVT